GEGNVADLSLDEVRKLDAGRWFSTDFSGERVPTIDEILSLAAGHREKDLLLAVDVKVDDPRVEGDLVALASRYKVLDRLVFIGRTIGDLQVRRGLKEASPRARTARLVVNATELEGALNDPDSDWLYVR